MRMHTYTRTPGLRRLHNFSWQLHKSRKKDQNQACDCSHGCVEDATHADNGALV